MPLSIAKRPITVVCRRKESLKKGFDYYPNGDETIEEILDSPMWTGHMMEFCESQFNAENLQFLLSVKRFREMFYPDETSWIKSWYEWDDAVLNDGSAADKVNWPSRTVKRSDVEIAIKKIVEQYLDDEAPDNICMSREIYLRTLKRAEFCNLYGPEVFSEAAIDPIKTLKKDILPRFLISDFYKEMDQQMKAGVRHYKKRESTLILVDEFTLQMDTETRLKPHENVGQRLLSTVFVHYPRLIFLNLLSKFSRPPIKENPAMLKSLLSKQWSYSVPATIALNLFLNLILGLEYYLRENPVCNEKHEFPFWVWMIDYTIVVGFVMSIFLNLNRMANSTGQLSNELYAALAGNIGVSVMAGTAVLLTTINNYGGTCRDWFGVVTPATQWPEWLTTVPFLIYTAVAVEDKPALSKDDWIVILGMFFCILTGYFLNIQTIPAWLAYTLLILSCLFMLSVVYMVVRAQDTKNKVLASDATALARAAHLAVAEQQRNLAILCLVAMPILPILYFMAVGHALSIDAFYAANNIMSCVVKLIFASIAAESHMATTEQMFAALETDVESAREGEAFAEHLFNKVTIPLKSVIAGLELMSDNLERQNPKDAAKLRNIRDTTSYINNNLNDLMTADRSTMRKEDAIQLMLSPFVLSDYLKTVLVTFQKQMRAKLILCKMDIKPAVPRTMVGDEIRLQNVLSVLFNAALTAAPSRSKMILSIDARAFVQQEDNLGDAILPFQSMDEEHKDKEGEKMKKGGNVAPRQLYSLCFEVTRTAPVSEVEDKYFLSMLAKKKDDPPADARSVLDFSRELSRAREIVVLHGGAVICSTMGKMTTVGFSIPFEMCNGTVAAISDV